ncbi:hypothetical protein [Sphingobium aquiterrae]
MKWTDQYELHGAEFMHGMLWAIMVSAGAFAVIALIIMTFLLFQ